MADKFFDSNSFVRYSRAGDRFHYCFAAKRSLLLLDQNSGLVRIVIEGDDTSGTSGEYSLDMTEVYLDGREYDRIKYQFKYSVERVNAPFTFSELKDTIVGFAENYESTVGQGKKLRYIVVTNRGVSKELKSCVETIATGGKSKSRTADSFLRNIKLRHDMLKAFCATLEFQDMEEDLETQFRNLRVQSASYIAGIPTVDSMYNLVDMVARKVLPKSDGVITKEDVLSNFCKGVSSIDAFYPAPVKFDEQGDLIETSGYKDVRTRVLNARDNVFIHAPGGLGKTVTLRMLAADIPPRSVAILFDCFAAGEYANRVRYRHTPEKACVQIANELAAKGLCDPLVADNGSSSQAVFEAFYKRVECAVGILRQKYADARLYVFIDAADNAHMIAADTNEPCFVDFVLSSSVIDGCTMVFSARTGRMKEFWPDYDCEKIELQPFTLSEVGEVLRLKFRNASSALAKQLFVRTSGFPRIVAGILADCKTVRDVEKASSFAPLTNYDTYLDEKYKVTLSRYSSVERGKLKRLCRCLVMLPPNVPIEVLGTAAKVSKDFIVGFISDWERPLWHSQEYVHFRDEPTETWFREKFGKDEGDLQEVITLITPLSMQYVYVARSLPSLLLKARAYDGLERIAESNEALPDKIHITEQKELQLERLRFAISAMIRSGKFSAAMRLSLLAGDMVSESTRREDTLRENLVFASKVLPKETVEELSATRQVELSWRGSENLCTGVLLSSLNDIRDQVGVYVNSAMRWLVLHIEKEKENSPERFGSHRNSYAYEASLLGRAILVANGPHEAVRHISEWRSAYTRYHAVSFLAHNCVSFDEKSLVEEMLQSTTDVYMLIGLINEAMDYGGRIVICRWQKIAHLILDLSDADKRHWDAAKDVRLSIARFAAWIACQKGGRLVAAKLLSKFVLPYMRFRTHDSPCDSDDDVLPFYVLARICQGKSCSVKAILRAIKIAFPTMTDYDLRSSQTRFEKLLPVYVGIIKAYLSADETMMSSGLVDAAHLLNDYQLFHQDKSRLFIDSLSWLSSAATKDMDCLHKFAEQNARVGLVSAAELLTLARVLCRRGLVDTGCVCLSRGTDCFEACKKDPQEYPDSLASLYIQAAEACYSIDLEDARGYFTEALNVLAKCGDELLPRWSAVTEMARRLSQPDARKQVSQKLVYEFTRCGEYVRSCVCKDKYYNRDSVFSILTDFSPAYAWATYSRWRDRRVGEFCYDLWWVLETLVQKGAMKIEEAWSFREFVDVGDVQRLADMVVQMSGSREFKQKVFDDLLSIYGKNGCTSHGFDAIRRLLEQLQVNVPTWLQLRSDDSSTSFTEVWHKRKDAIELSTFDGNDPDWLYSTLLRIKGILDSDFKRKILFSKVPEMCVCQLLRLLATDERIHHFDINEIIMHLPSGWQKKPGVRAVMPNVLTQLVARYVKGGWENYVGGILVCADEFGIGQQITREFLCCMANVGSLNSESYFQIVKNGIRILPTEEMVGVFDYALKRVSEGMGDGFGDGDWTSAMWPVKSFNEVTKDLLWTAMGDPNAEIRWMATHCVVNELLRAPDEMVADYIKRLSILDFTPCVSANLPTYIYDSRVHFLLALAKVAKRVAPQICANMQELIAFLQGQEHVLIRYLGWNALMHAGIDVKKIPLLNPIDCMTIKEVDCNSWGVFKPTLHESIKGIIANGGRFPMHYDFEKYWLSSFARVFGFDNNDCNALLKWIAPLIIDEGVSFTIAQDPRNSQFYNDDSTHVSSSGMPDQSDYNFYISYHSLLILAGRMLQCQPVVKYLDDTENRFCEWIKDFLPVFSPDLSVWQSDVRGKLPTCVIHSNELKTVIEQESLKDISMKKLLCLSGDDEILIDGHWQIGEYAKEFECSLNCALVSRDEAVRTRENLCHLKDPMGLALPTLFDNPNEDWRNHGSFKWRGLYDSDPEYLRYYIDEKDTAVGGLHIIRFDIAKQIRKDLKLIDKGDHISLLFKDGGPAFVSWYWCVPRCSRKQSLKTYGCTLKTTHRLLNELCLKYNSELIIEAILKRYKYTYRHNYADREEETCYRYALYSPERGLY